MGRRSRCSARLISSNDAIGSAVVAGLRYVDATRTRGISRIGTKVHPRYLDPTGKAVTDHPTELARIRLLAVPPAWTNVWISPSSRSHLQATGRDARGRKQYRYHPRWRSVRDEVKYSRVIAFARALPAIRARSAADLKRSGLPREKVLAAVVQLLEKTLIRVGNDEYARQNSSFGLTTMRVKHAKIQAGRIHFEFRGKGGIAHAIDLDDVRLARIVKACRDLPGYELFQYVDDDGERQIVDSADVNAYIREITGENFSAKDFRTWGGTVLAAKALAEIGRSNSSSARRHIARAIETVAKQLGNTKVVCRKSYIHPAILEAYMKGATIRTATTRAARFSSSQSGPELEEAAVIEMIEHQPRHNARPRGSETAA